MPALLMHDTAKILGRWLSQRLLEHGDERRDRFVAEIGRDLLNRRAVRQFPDCNDQVQLLSPAPEGEPGFPDDQSSETAVTEGNMIGPGAEGSAVGGIYGQCFGDELEARFR